MAASVATALAKLPDPPRASRKLLPDILAILHTTQADEVTQHTTSWTTGEQAVPAGRVCWSIPPPPSITLSYHHICSQVLCSLNMGWYPGGRSWMHGCTCCWKLFLFWRSSWCGAT